MFVEIAFPLAPAPLPIKSKPVEVSLQTQPSGDKAKTPSFIRKSSYWTWTFKLTLFPFIFWSCPVYIVTTTKQSVLDSPITSTRSWLEFIFNCKRFPCTSFFSIFLLIFTVLINMYVSYTFVDLFNNLFIRGSYEISMLSDVLDFIRYLPIAIPLNYVWLKGYKLNNLISLLDQVHRKYGRVGCSTFRIRLVLMLLIILVIHTVRYFNYEKYLLTNKQDFRSVVGTLSDFSLDIFCTLLLPLYCTFCYAIKFELLVIKGVIYDLMRKKVVPSVAHLNKFKALYTRAADHILQVNRLFSMYLSLALLILLVGTAADAENLWGTLGTALSSAFGGSSPWTSFFTWLLQLGEEDVNGVTAGGMTPEEIRQINADIACILLTYGLIFYTVWQAVGTNDSAREIHVWLNDFVTGGAGTDVCGILKDLGFITKETEFRDKSNVVSATVPKAVEGVDDEEEIVDVIWASNNRLDSQEEHEFIQKFHMLKSYIHVRMEIEKASLLSITLIGWLVPSLSGRLKRYNVLY
ncbi:unnamed protein product [Orchesella dallaii]|uniref:Gustatory receptor n=1 Tax=Orchesella dallaii TaxID=48710 RepID=A0ABP1Q3E6_9HEXA